MRAGDLIFVPKNNHYWFFDEAGIPMFSSAVGGILIFLGEIRFTVDLDIILVLSDRGKRWVLKSMERYTNPSDHPEWEY